MQKGNRYFVRSELPLLLLFFSVAMSGCGGGPSNPSPPPPNQVRLTVSVTGSGIVTSNPAGINCPDTCTANFPSGTSVTLTAAAASGFNFSGFSGACSGSSCKLVLSNDQDVSAAFVASSSDQLTVSITGSGTVTSSPVGISCPNTCIAGFSDGTTVTLIATPASGSTFSSFGGACSGTTCQLTLTGGQSVNVSATFSQGSPPKDLSAINHIIILLQENRSFDHYFGHLPDYWQAHGFPQHTNGTTFDGLPSTASNIDPNGDAIGASNMQTACTENPSPSWNESHVDRNKLAPEDPNAAPMDGYVRTAAHDASLFYDVLGHRAMGYFVGDNQLNYYYFMASTFATSDRWFAPLLSRTQPNRMYLYGATSQGHVYPLQATNSPPLTSETIVQLLQDNSIGWKIYVHPDASGCSTLSCLYNHSYLSQFTYGKFVLNNLPNQFASTTQLINDMQNGTLPQVSFIEPAGDAGLDEHSATSDANAPNVQAGAAFVQNLVDTLMASPSWKDSVFILSYDEPGGFYDHVPPQPAVPPDSIQYPTDLAATDVCAGNTTSPVCGFFVTGYRVPLIVISPFTKANYVSHTIMDYTAMLKLIETRFKLPSLTARDAAQPDMTEFFDFVNVPWAAPPTPPKQVRNLPCVLEVLSAISVSPNPAPAGGQATVTLSLVKNAIKDATVSLSSNTTGVLPASTVITTGNASTALPINVPSGITSLTITGSLGGIPVSATVPVQ
jgi:phospholipase C